MSFPFLPKGAYVFESQLLTGWAKEFICPLAEKIISNEIYEGSEVKISANDIGLSIQAA